MLIRANGEDKTFSGHKCRVFISGGYLADVVIVTNTVCCFLTERNFRNLRREYCVIFLLHTQSSLFVITEGPKVESILFYEGSSCFI